MNSAKRLGLALGFIVITFGWFSGAKPVFACLCAVSTPEEYFDKATTVFTGTVTSVTEQGMKRSVDFDLNQVLKGPARQQATVITGQGSGDCGVSFETGQEYIVYADGKDELSTSICSGTTLLDATDDMDKPIIVNTLEPAPEATNAPASPTTLIIIAGVAFVGGILTARLVRSKSNVHRD